jgi:hypothetical protein
VSVCVIVFVVCASGLVFVCVDVGVRVGVCVRL